MIFALVLAVALNAYAVFDSYKTWKRTGNKLARSNIAWMFVMLLIMVCALIYEITAA